MGTRNLIVEVERITKKDLQKKMNLHFIVFLVFVNAFLIGEAAIRPDCGCTEGSGGCRIRIAPPYGYKCECELIMDRCFGTPKKCDDSDVGTPGCKGCFGEECCSGNCGGYVFG